MNLSICLAKETINGKSWYCKRFLIVQFQHLCEAAIFVGQSYIHVLMTLTSITINQWSLGFAAVWADARLKLIGKQLSCLPCYAQLHVKHTSTYCGSTLVSSLSCQAIWRQEKQKEKWSMWLKVKILAPVEWNKRQCSVGGFGGYSETKVEKETKRR